MEDTVSATLGRLTAIWTYPVKSLRRVEHDTIEIERDGLVGDRRAALYVTAPEHARSGKTYRGKEDNRLHLLDEPDAARNAAADRGVGIEVRAGERYFDAGDVSLILDCWIAEAERALGRPLEPARWRPNLFLRAHVDVAEAELAGTDVTLGSCVLRVLRPILRCVTPSYDLVTGESDPQIQRFVAQERANVMGVYCEVVQPGSVRKGDYASINRVSGDLRPLAPT